MMSTSEIEKGKNVKKENIKKYDIHADSYRCRYVLFVQIDALNTRQSDSKMEGACNKLLLKSRILKLYVCVGVLKF
jgi:hypothetical protein